MGMKDQVQALNWVHQNIQYYNGDPKHVTIFGYFKMFLIYIYKEQIRIFLKLISENLQEVVVFIYICSHQCRQACFQKLYLNREQQYLHSYFQGIQQNKQNDWGSN
jgi:hypothetical protein